MKKKSLCISIFAIFTCFNVFATAPIEVVENTLKVRALSEETFFYGFAAGDELILNFEEVNGKELQELEIIEMPTSSRFMDYKTKKIENRTVHILTGGIYKFRFSNSSLLPRICKFKVQRIPASEATANFNTSVYTKDVYDTTFLTEQETYLEKTDTIASDIINQLAKVHSQGNPNGNKTTLNFSLPKNTISWSYYIGVDQEGQKAYESASDQIAATSSLISKIPCYGPLAALALGATPYFSKIQGGEDIDYYIVFTGNENLFLAGQAFRYIKKGKVINDFARMSPTPEGLHICFSNDNAITGVSVLVKITAIQVFNKFNTRPVQKLKVTARKEMYLKS